MTTYPEFVEARDECTRTKSALKRAKADERLAKRRFKEKQSPKRLKAQMKAEKARIKAEDAYDEAVADYNAKSADRQMANMEEKAEKARLREDKEATKHHKKGAWAGVKFDPVSKQRTASKRSMKNRNVALAERTAASRAAADDTAKNWIEDEEVVLTRSMRADLDMELEDCHYDD